MSKNEKKKSIIREYVEAIAIALILALFIRTFIVQAFKIPSGSMLPTLKIGDHLLVNKFIYGIKNPLNGALWISVSQPERKDVIVFEYPVDPSKDFIKRVIGLPGDQIEIKDKKVYLNGKPFRVDSAVFLDSRVIPGRLSPRDNYGPVTVPEKSLFVMGDNRDNSHDSRFWGFVEYEEVKGKAFILYWSWNSDKFSPRWSRIGDTIH